MQLKINQQVPALFLRIAISIAYLWAVADRLGMIGAYGQPGVSWGDWQHFAIYAKQTMAFLPPSLAEVFAVIASVAEGLIGLMLLMGSGTRIAAVGSGILSFCFATAMWISFGISSPLSYSVFTLSAASFLLATIPCYSFSLDALKLKRIEERLPLYGGNDLIDIVR